MPYRYHLVFGKDATLRFAFDFFDKPKNAWQQALIPVASAEMIARQSLFLPALRGTVEVEPNTALRAIMNSLKPWADPLGDLLDKDIASFIAEAQRPVAVTERLALDNIIINGYVSFEPRVEYLDTTEFIEQATETRTYKEPKFEPQNRFEVTIDWTASGREADSPFAIGLFETPINAYAHVPVILQKQIEISDKTQLIPGRMITREPLLNARSPVVEDTPWGRRDGRHLQMGGTAVPNVFQFLTALLSEVCPAASPERRNQHRDRSAKDNAIRNALDRQEGKDQKFFARDPFASLFAHAKKTSSETRDLMRRASENGVEMIVRDKIDD